MTFKDRVCPTDSRVIWAGLAWVVARTLRVCFAFFVLYYKQVRLALVLISIRCRAAFLFARIRGFKCALAAFYMKLLVVS